MSLSICGSQALEHRLNNCGPRAQLLFSMWDLPGSGIEPVSPALAGRLFTTEPPALHSHLNPSSSLMPMYDPPQPVFSLPLSPQWLGHIIYLLFWPQGFCTCCSLCPECSDRSILPLCTIWNSFEMSLSTPRYLLWPTAVPPPPGFLHHIYVLCCLSCIYYLEWLWLSDTDESFFILWFLHAHWHGSPLRTGTLSI